MLFHCIQQEVAWSLLEHYHKSRVQIKSAVYFIVRLKVFLILTWNLSSRTFPSLVLVWVLKSIFFSYVIFDVCDSQIIFSAHLDCQSAKLSSLSNAILLNPVFLTSYLCCWIFKLSFGTSHLSQINFIVLDVISVSSQSRYFWIPSFIIQSI